MARTKSSRSWIIKAIQIFFIVIATAVVLLYGWAFITLESGDLKASDDQRGDFLGNRKIVLNGRAQSEGFPKIQERQEQGLHGDSGKAEASPHEAPRRTAKRPMTFPFMDPKYRIYKLPEHDTSARCRLTGICDGNHTCGPDKLGCVTSGEARQARIREAARWSWAGYK